MFILFRVTDTIEIEPAYFSPERLHELERQTSTSTTVSTAGQPTSSPQNTRYVPTLEDILWHRISERYVGRVVPCRGLCIAVAELVSYSNSTVRGNDGSSWTTVVFDCVLFRPYVGERLRATIHRQTEKGLYLSVEVFHDIFIPASLLVQPSVFDDVAGSWYLRIDSEDGNGVEKNLYRNGDVVLVAVREVVVRSSVDQLSAIAATTNVMEDDQPMSIVGSFLDVGLGPCVWFE